MGIREKPFPRSGEKALCFLDSWERRKTEAGSQSRCATGLRHAPNYLRYNDLDCLSSSFYFGSIHELGTYWAQSRRRLPRGARTSIASAANSVHPGECAGLQNGHPANNSQKRGGHDLQVSCIQRTAVPSNLGRESGMSARFRTNGSLRLKSRTITASAPILAP